MPDKTIPVFLCLTEDTHKTFVGDRGGIDSSCLCHNDTDSGNMELQELEATVTAIPSDSPEKAEALNELGKRLWQTALQTNSEDTLRRAVSTIEEAVRMTETKSDLSKYLNNLGLFLSDLASFSGDKTYWEQAISSLERGS